MIPEIENDIQELAKWWKEIQCSDTARKEDDIAALRGLDHEELVSLAFRALNVIEDLEDLNDRYLIGMVRAHAEPTAFPRCGWVIAQADSNGGFNSHSKVGGGQTGPVVASWAVHEFWQKAKQALDAYDDDIRQYHKIFPAVLVIGGEPRTTKPWRCDSSSP